MATTNKQFEMFIDGPPTRINIDKLAYLLNTAFEGGSNYWYRELEIESLPEGFQSFEEVTKVFKETTALGILAEYPWYTLPFIGGSIIFEDQEEPNAELPYRLNLESIKKGMSIMAQKYPKHWGDFIAENEDAVTGDVFLQCCVFGEVIYG